MHKSVPRIGTLVDILSHINDNEYGRCLNLMHFPDQYVLMPQPLAVRYVCILWPFPV